MKKLLFSFVAVTMMFTFGLTFYSCGSGKPVTAENPYGQQVTLTECEAYALQQPGKRISGKGVSYDESVARQLAELDARAKYSDALEAAIISASKKANVEITQYAGGDNDGMSATDGGAKSNTLAKSVSGNIIKNTNVVKVDKFFGKNRQYTIFVCLEYQGNMSDIAKEAANQVKQRVSDVDREKIQRELDDFQKEVEDQLIGNTQK